MNTSDNEWVSRVIGNAGFTPRKGEVAKVALEIRRLGKVIDVDTVREVATRLAVRDTATMQAEHRANVGLDEDGDAVPVGLEALRKALEALHGDVLVIDGRATGQGNYALKLQTPVGVHLSEGTAAGWMAQAREDVEAASRFECPFCHRKVAWDGGERGGSCPSCSACHDRDVGRLATRCGLVSSGADVAVAALADIGGTFHEDRRHNVFWARSASWLKGHPLGKALQGVEGPSRARGITDIALLVDADLASGEVIERAGAATTWREVVALGEPEADPVGGDHDDPPDDNWLRVGWCRNCVHGLVTHDGSDSISGVWSSFHSEDRTHCVRPLDARKDLKDLREMLDPQPTKARGYRTNHVGTFANSLIDAAMAGLFRVDARGEGLEGRAPEELGGYVGPLCPAYAPDPDALFEWGDHRLAGAKAPVEFGEPDHDRIAREEKAERLRLDWAATGEIMRALRSDRVGGPVLRKKIQMSNVTDLDADRARRPPGTPPARRGPGTGPVHAVAGHLRHQRVGNGGHVPGRPAP